MSSMYIASCKSTMLQLSLYIIYNSLLAYAEFTIKRTHSMLKTRVVLSLCMYFCVYAIKTKISRERLKCDKLVVCFVVAV